MSGPSALIEAYLEGPVKLRRAVIDLSSEQLLARPVPAGGARWRSSVIWSTASRRGAIG